MSSTNVEAGQRGGAEAGLGNVIGSGSFDASEFKPLRPNRQLAIADSTTGIIIAMFVDAAAARAWLREGRP